MNSHPEICPIAGFQGYGVSRDGQIWTRKNARWGLRDEWRGMAPRTTTTGYKMALLSRNKKTFPMLIHRIVFETFVGKIPHGLDINHINGIKSDNRIENLESATRRENMQHASRIGLLAVGEKNASAKLTKSDVDAIFLMRAEGFTHQKIGSIVGCSRSNIGLILNGINWAHLRKTTGGIA